MARHAVKHLLRRLRGWRNPETACPVGVSRPVPSIRLQLMREVS
jgi:hypothetical protein